MNFAPLLAADIVDIARAIILFVILAGGVARLFIDANRAQKKAPPPPQRPKPARPGAPPANPQQEAIRAEVDEFLRRAGRENAPRAEAAPRGGVQRVEPQPANRPPRIEVLDDSGIKLERQPRRSEQRRETEGEQRKRHAKRAGMSEEGTRPSFGGTSVALKTDRIGSQLSARAAELGHEIRQADDRFEARIHERFEHPIGTLANRQREEAEALRVELTRTTLADDLMKMLSSPAGVRQALVLHEVLSRPVDRW